MFIVIGGNDVVINGEIIGLNDIYKIQCFCLK